MTTNSENTNSDATMPRENEEGVYNSMGGGVQSEQNMNVQENSSSSLDRAFPSSPSEPATASSSDISTDLSAQANSVAPFEAPSVGASPTTNEPLSGASVPFSAEPISATTPNDISSLPSPDFSNTSAPSRTQVSNDLSSLKESNAHQKSQETLKGQSTLDLQPELWAVKSSYLDQSLPLLMCFLAACLPLAMTVCHRFVSTCSRSFVSFSSFFAGSGLSILMVSVLPQLFYFLQKEQTAFSDSYLSDPIHFILVGFICFGFGFVLNYGFDKKSKEPVLHTFHGILFHLILFSYGSFMVKIQAISLFQLFQYALIIGFLLHIYAQMINFSFLESQMRKLCLGVFPILGVLFAGMGFHHFILPAYFLMIFFMIGYGMYAAFRVDLQTQEGYRTFLIGFLLTAFLNLLISLHQSITQCSC